MEILLVEDCPLHLRIMMEALQNGRIGTRINVATDGDKALAFLRREGEFRDAPRPDVILLDLNLPKRNGRSVLAAIKTSPALRTIPVLILTTSENGEDIAGAYDLHANSYITKPNDVEGFVSAVQAIEHFWLKVVCLPSMA